MAVCDTTIDPAHVSTAPLFSNETGPPSSLSIADSTGSFMALDDPLGTEVHAKVKSIYHSLVTWSLFLLLLKV